MKPFRYLLLILVFSVHATHAQQNIQLRNQKLSPVLKAGKQILSKHQVQVFWLVTSNIDSAKKYISQKQLPVSITGEYAGGLLVVRGNWQTIDSLLLGLPFIKFVDVPRQPHEEVAVGLFNNSLNTINMVHSRFPQLTGNGMIVSVKENKPDTADIDFTGRYISSSLSSPSITSHATVMSTIIAGGGNSFFTGEGVAPAASIHSSNFATLLPDADNVYRQYGISVQNHSYGTGIENYYGADAAAYDASINNNTGLMHIFSAGNLGNNTSTGTYAGITNFANISGSFKMAKNIITVGATDTFGNVVDVSSRGPAYDGRVKPELVAFGEDGSSGAAAHTSGTVLLLQQQYKQQFGAMPPSALTKAIMLNSADDVGAPGPDFQSGYGSLNAVKAMQNLVNAQFFSGPVAQGAVQTFSLVVPANTRQLKITLCWNDPAAAANAPKALVNDLDLELINNSNAQLWQPWVLNPAPIQESLLLPAVRKKDTLNNVEQISIDNPAAGSYTIRVRGSVVPVGAQPFYIAWLTDAADQFQWQYPVSTDYIQGAQNNLLRWSSTYNTTAGLLEYSVNKGATWQVISNAAPLTAQSLYWNAPDTFCTGLLRMTINGEVYTSDTFTISSPVSVKVGFNCADSVMLLWDRVPSVSAYTVYRLGEKYLQPVTTITDTSIILRQPNGAPWYTVAPVISTNRPATKAYTINYNLQGVNCYLKTFLADLENGNTALLTIEIGTNYNVKSISVEKLSKEGYRTLQNIQPVTTPYYQLTDNNLTDGTNTYRLKIELTNGLIIYSNPESVYYFLITRYIIFPNPAKATGSLQVLTKEEPVNTQLLLFNTLGQKVLQYNLQDLATSVPLSGLKSGIYFMLIIKNGKKDFTGKVMVQ